MSIASLLTTTDLAAAIQAGTRGDVVAPDDPSFAAATFGLDLAAAHRPEMVVIAAVAADVAVTAGLAARAGRRVAIANSGSTTGATGPGTVLVVTRLLARVSIDPAAATATVGSGATWRQVLDAAVQSGLAPVSGSMPGSGAVGYRSGRGPGPVARAFGFAAEFVQDYEVVTALGEVVHANADQRPELFAELRAGRSASVVVTAMTIRLVPADSLLAGGIWFSAEEAEAVLAGWQEWAETLPPAATTSLARLTLPAVAELPQPLRGRDTVHVRFNHVGDPDLGARLLSAIETSATPLFNTVRRPTRRPVVVDAAPATMC